MGTVMHILNTKRGVWVYFESKRNQKVLKHMLGGWQIKQIYDFLGILILLLD